MLTLKHVYSEFWVTVIKLKKKIFLNETKSALILTEQIYPI